MAIGERFVLSGEPDNSKGGNRETGFGGFELPNLVFGYMAFSAPKPRFLILDLERFSEAHPVVLSRSEGPPLLGEQVTGNRSWPTEVLALVPASLSLFPAPERSFAAAQDDRVGF